MTLFNLRLTIFILLHPETQTLRVCVMERTYLNRYLAPSLSAGTPSPRLLTQIRDVALNIDTAWSFPSLPIHHHVQKLAAAGSQLYPIIPMEYSVHHHPSRLQQAP